MSEAGDFDLAVLQRLPSIAVRIGYVDVYLLYGVLHLRRDALRRELSACSPALQAFVQLFALHDAVPETRLDAVLNAAERAALMRLGVLLRQGSALSTGGLTLIPLFGQLALVPTPITNPVAYFGDDVAGLLTRINTALPRPGPATTALNLYAGAGLAALVAASRCQRVIAVEHAQLPRACAELNMMMNGLAERVEILDPASFASRHAGQRFAHVYANTPLVPFPQRLFSPPGQPHADADELSPVEVVFESLPGLLHRDGHAQIVGVDLGDGRGPRSAAWLEQLARQHDLKIVLTIPYRAELPRETHVLDLLAIACQAMSGLPIDNARDRLRQHLDDSGHHSLYLFYATVSWGSAGALSINRFDPLGRGFWFR